MWVLALTTVLAAALAVRSWRHARAMARELVHLRARVRELSARLATAERRAVTRVEEPAAPVPAQRGAGAEDDDVERAGDEPGTRTVH